MSYYDNATLMTLKLGPWQQAEGRQVGRMRRHPGNTGALQRKLPKLPWLSRLRLFSPRVRKPRPAA